MNKQYIIALNKKRSIIALLACTVELLCCLYSIYCGIVLYVKEGYFASTLFEYFTVLSGSYGALVSSFIIPFAIDGYRKKRFTYPRWTALLHYSSTLCTTLVFVFAVCFISFYDPVMAFGGYNFNLHVVCPILILIAFFLVEANHSFTARDTFTCMTPVFVYAAVYLYNVVIVKRWEDFYHFTSFIPFYFSLILMLLLAYGIAFLIRILNNRKNALYRKRLMEKWDDDLDEVAIKIEVYGLGRYMGLSGQSSNVTMNLDILMDIAEKYGIKLEGLTRAYGKGVIDGVKEVQEKRKQKQGT